MDRIRIAHMLRHASARIGVLLVDDMGLPTKEQHSVRLGRMPVVAEAGFGDQASLLNGLETRALPCVVALAGWVHPLIAEEMEQGPGDGPPPGSTTRGHPRKAKMLAKRVQTYEAGGDPCRPAGAVMGEACIAGEVRKAPSARLWRGCTCIGQGQGASTWPPRRG